MHCNSRFRRNLRAPTAVPNQLHSGVVLFALLYGVCSFLFVMQTGGCESPGGEIWKELWPVYLVFVLIIWSVCRYFTRLILQLGWFAFQQFFKCH